MKTNFALSLSFDGLRLMHRTAAGWTLVGQVALDNADVSAALEKLRGAAETLEPTGIATKLLIPNDQIKYLALDTTRAEDEQVREALHGATPYNVDELVYDFAKGGGRTYIAAVAKETLVEAQEFASEHGFNPISFAAVPEPFTYMGEAFFGSTDGHTGERDDEPVIVIGTALVTVEEDAPAPKAELEPDQKAEDTADQTEVADVTKADDVSDDPIVSDILPVFELKADVAADDVVEIVEDSIEDPVDDVVEPDQETLPLDDGPAVMFASRLRADRNEGRPPEPSSPSPAPPREEPVFSRQPPPDLAVPINQSSENPAPLSAARREAASAPTTSIVTDVPDTDSAPSITGDAPSAVPADTLSDAASVTVKNERAENAPVQRNEAEPELQSDPLSKSDTSKSGGIDAATIDAAAMGAATTVSSAVGGMFASRRLDGAQEQRTQDEAKGPEKSARTVFGARKEPKPQPVVGGKPRFLGLILTAILLLFLLAFAAFAAMTNENIVRWLGWTSDNAQVATDTDTAAQTPLAAAPTDQDIDAPSVEIPSETPALEPDNPVVADVSDAPAAPTVQPTGQVLSPEDAARIYASTGVWQRSPRITVTPRTTSIEGLTFGAAATPVTRVPSSPLVTASDISGDALIATPIDPPAPETTFDFGDDGLIVATPDGNVTPDGILVIAGSPALNPPARPGTVAPEITPQDQIAAVIPDTAAPIENAPAGVIIIAGRPVIEPPVRTGTFVPAPAPQIEALAQGDAPLLATDGLLVLAGSPPVLPPIRRATQPPNAPLTGAETPDEITPVQPSDVAAEPQSQDPIDASPVISEATTLPSDTPAEVPGLSLDALPEGLNIIAGAPSILPPVRPGTVAPQVDTSVQNLTTDITAALATSTAQAPREDTTRPLLRPAEVIQAAAAIANSPVLGELTATEASAFRPRTRPAGLAPTPPPTVEPEVVPQDASAPAAPTGLQIAPELAAAIEAAANRPNPIVNPTALAVPVSSRPDPRPQNMARIVARASETQQRAAAQVASVAPSAVAPSGPTGSAVAQNATLENAINLRDVNLIGIYGGSNDRRALVRLANGRYVRVTVGDRLDGGRVTAISSSALSYTKSGRSLTLQVAG